MLGSGGSISPRHMTSYFSLLSLPILVENMPDDLQFMGSSGYACDTFHQYGGDGCYTQGQGFQSVEVDAL